MLSSISFGKIVKVNAPVKTAQKIILMSHRHTEAGRKLNAILNENKPGKAHAYSFPDKEEESYIFTGVEGQKYWKSHCEAWDKIEHSHHYYKGDRETANAQTAWSQHSKNVAGIIKSYNGKMLELDEKCLEDKNQININI